jgi:hypothetical protein
MFFFGLFPFSRFFKLLIFYLFFSFHFIYFRTDAYNWKRLVAIRKKAVETLKKRREDRMVDEYGRLIHQKSIFSILFGKKEKVSKFDEEQLLSRLSEIALLGDNLLEEMNIPEYLLDEELMKISGEISPDDETDKSSSGIFKSYDRYLLEQVSKVNSKNMNRKKESLDVENKIYSVSSSSNFPSILDTNSVPSFTSTNSEIDDNNKILVYDDNPSHPRFRSKGKLTHKITQKNSTISNFTEKLKEIESDSIIKPYTFNDYEKGNMSLNKKVEDEREIEKIWDDVQNTNPVQSFVSIAPVHISERTYVNFLGLIQILELQQDERNEDLLYPMSSFLCCLVYQSSAFVLETEGLSFFYIKNINKKEKISLIAQEQQLKKYITPQSNNTINQKCINPSSISHSNILKENNQIPKISVRENSVEMVENSTTSTLDVSKIDSNSKNNKSVFDSNISMKVFPTYDDSNTKNDLYHSVLKNLFLGLQNSRTPSFNYYFANNEPAKVFSSFLFYIYFIFEF